MRAQMGGAPGNVLPRSLLFTARSGIKDGAYGLGFRQTNYEGHHLVGIAARCAARVR
jgi:hypothetical protein